ncbi:cyclopropane-fatty-acyl-phospholipid synthase [Xylona heveae TC161]|uniref:Cyclopropane-fatty-acyl-phospholipid synthase n=1 Tax=Xylona heveae (strain CBS 132557 / TC161) TaxID=1328760 RepID=A0A165HBH2_XYLHT|nr:cyclopropane-fatty-acyl-phospholipid synthase [Xylona heveae TC161]KZF23255.1 cyclopropane-fatty-acyl-phospholipid synthase [Xylona heveae TC161]
MAIADSVSNRFQLLRAYTADIAWEPFLQFSRRAVISLFSRIRRGNLELIDRDGSITKLGSSGDTPSVRLAVKDEIFWVRLLLYADMGFAESYMLNEFDCSDLVAFFRLFIRNREQLSNGTTLSSSLMSAINGIARKSNTLSNARLNISAHYDISNAMFAAFLSKDMTYSCPIWLPISDPRHVTETLEEAQERKLQRFISNARIKYTDRVLEIGTGWGSFAIAAVKAIGCRVTSLTLSIEQKALAEKKIAAAGLTDNIEVIICDYRALEVPDEGPFDKVVSIEMLEAVGREYLHTYFECIDRLLKKDGGIAVFQCITMPESRYEAYSKGEDFIRKYIFPGGHLPTVTQLTDSIQRGTAGSLIIDSVENIGPHYAKTLRLWRENFMQNFALQIRPALLEEHAGMTVNEVEVFRRKWEYYFTYCEAGFNTKTLGDVIITASREGTMEMLEDVPL